MRVMVCATTYPSSLTDWRGLFIRHMVDALARHGHTIELWAPPGDNAAAVVRTTTAEDDAWLDDLLGRGGVAHLLRNQPVAGLVAGTRLLRMLAAAMRASTCEIFHVNWLQCALALPRDGRPALVTVLGTDLQLLRLPGIAALMRRSFRGRRVVLCPNAEWMVEPLRARFPDLPVQPVPFGIDEGWFRLDTTRTDREERWLAVTRITRGKIGHLFEWGEPHFDGRNRVLHLLGPMQESLPIPRWVVAHGATHPSALMQQWFPGAHGLVSLSRHSEGRPQVMIEAMAAGLPIIASRIPAHSDLIDHGRTGFVVDSGEELGQVLAALGDAATRARVGNAARSYVQEAVGTWGDCAARYDAVYRQLLAATSQ